MPTDWASSTTTAPALEPVTVDEAKRNCDIPALDVSREAELQLWIKEARQQVENDARIRLLTQTVSYKLRRFSGTELEIPGVWPIQSLTVSYQDANDSAQTLATTVYGVDTSRRPCVVYLKKLQQWPITYGGYEDVTFTITAGYSRVADVPGAARSAILMLVRHRFEHPDLVMSGQVMEMPQGYKCQIGVLRGGTYP